MSVQFRASALLVRVRARAGIVHVHVHVHVVTDLARFYWEKTVPGPCLLEDGQVLSFNVVYCSL